MSTLLRLCFCSVFLLGSTVLPAQSAPSTSPSSGKAAAGPTHEQGLMLWRSIGLYSGAMMSNAYVSLVCADHGLKGGGHNLEDMQLLVSQEQATLKRLEDQSNRLRVSFAAEKDICAILDSILGGVTLLKAQADALSDVINGKSRTEAGVDAKRQAARAYLLKMMGEKEDSTLLP